MASLKTCGFVALDGITQQQTLHYAGKLAGLAYGVKVEGAPLHGTISTKALLGELRGMGYAVFADAKILRRPSAAAAEVRALTWCGADFITVHGSGGYKMVSACVDAFAQGTRVRTGGILVIAAPTWLTDDESRDLYGQDLTQRLHAVVPMAVAAGAWGVICAPTDLKHLHVPPRLKPVTPGIEFEGLGSENHARSDTPENALAMGAKNLVIGTAITTGWDLGLMRARISRIDESIAHLP